MVEELHVNVFGNLYAGAFRQFTVDWMGWLGLWIFMWPFTVGAEGFRFKYFHLEYCGISFFLWFIDVILISFCYVCIDGLEVIFSYEVLYFHIIVWYRKNEYNEN
jgi:hypothetical protein